MDELNDRIIYRHDLREILQVTHETMQRWIQTGKLPKPDVDISRKKVGWKMTTLRNAGLNIF